MSLFENNYLNEQLNTVFVSNVEDIQGKQYMPLFKNITHLITFVAPLLKIQPAQAAKSSLRTEFKRFVCELRDRHRIHKASTASNMEIYMTLTGQVLPDYYIKLLIFYAYWDDWLDEGEDRAYILRKFEWVRQVFVPACSDERVKMDRSSDGIKLPPARDLDVLRGWIYTNPKRDVIIPLFMKLLQCEIDSIHPVDDVVGMKARVYSAFYMLKAAQEVFPFFGQFYDIPNWAENISILLSLTDDMLDLKQDIQNNQWTYFNNSNPYLTLVRLNNAMPLLYKCLEAVGRDMLQLAYIDNIDAYVFAYIHVCMYRMLLDVHGEKIAEPYFDAWKNFMFPKEEHDAVMECSKMLVALYGQANMQFT